MSIVRTFGYPNQKKCVDPGWDTPFHWRPLVPIPQVIIDSILQPDAATQTNIRETSLVPKVYRYNDVEVTASAAWWVVMATAKRRNEKKGKCTVCNHVAIIPERLEPSTLYRLMCRAVGSRCSIIRSSGEFIIQMHKCGKEGGRGRICKKPQRSKMHMRIWRSTALPTGRSPFVCSQRCLFLHDGITGRRYEDNTTGSHGLKLFPLSKPPSRARCSMERDRRHTARSENPYSPI